MRDKKQATTAVATTREEAPLSPQRAFVVQFRARVGAEQELFSGRAEHMTSGRATRFQSLEELVAFLKQILAEVKEKPP